MDVFREGKFKFLALMETKLKGNGEVSLCGENVIIAGVQEKEGAREGVAILLNDVRCSAVIDFGYVSSRILIIEFKFSRAIVYVVVGYSPSEGDVEERDRFWNDMDRILDRVQNGDRLCILGDLNRWIGDKTRTGIIGAFGVPGENDNSRRVVELCAERGLCVCNTYFKHRSLHKYTRLGKGSSWNRGKQHGRSGTGEEGYAALCARCEISERNEMRPIRSPCGTM